jgi:N-acetylglucosaminyl-diphospho-decaprenol L-rhamnosyltransferase
VNDLDATAVVVTYNSQDHVVACLSALRCAGLRVNVVDNASTDGTVQVVAAHFPEIALIANPVNVGFAAAVNQALPGAVGNVVLLVNPDCVLREPTARALVTTLRLRPEVGIAGPRIIDPGGRLVAGAHPFESLASVLTSRFGGSLVPVGRRWLFCGKKRRRTYDDCGLYGHAVPVDWVSGACLAVRASLLAETGGLDEGYFMYYADEELCLQAWRRGAHVLYVPALTAVHLGGASSTDPVQLWPHLYGSMLRFFGRHRRRSFPLVRATVLVRASLGVALTAVPRRGRSLTRNARAQAWASVVRLALTSSRPNLKDA